MNFEKNETSLEVQEQEKFRIAWKNKDTGATGHGEYVNKEIADAWLEKENKKHPELEHWLEPEEKENDKEETESSEDIG